VTGATTADLRAARDAAQGADLVEVRLDTASDPDPLGVVAGRRCPVLVTCRAAFEGGKFTGSEEARERLLASAIDAGAEYVDVEFAAAFRDRLIARAPSRCVVSAHDFTGVPADLAERFTAMRATAAAIVKVAVMTPRLADQLPLFDLAARQSERGRHVLIGMGEAGIASRVLSARLGNAWTYAGHAVAPGQIPAARMLGEFRFGRCTATTPVFGVVGKPIAHSVSPAIHNAAFADLGMDAVYLPLAAQTFDDFLAFARAIGLVGASVTAPFKRDALASAARVDDVARRVGAANTVRLASDGQWESMNADVDGFLAPLDAVALEDKRVAVLGAGGAARAVLAALASRGARSSVCARRRDAAQELASQWGAGVGAFPPTPGSWDVLVNTTPVGTWPDVDALPIPPESASGPLVYDLVYNPPRTALMRAAAARGAMVIGGLDMLVAQAARQFEWWTGRAPSLNAMRQAAERALPGARDDHRPSGDDTCR
jgi:3-dehydroquinate dehydratase/shikimate dehydrogenase